MNGRKKEKGRGKEGENNKRVESERREKGMEGKEGGREGGK